MIESSGGLDTMMVRVVMESFDPLVKSLQGKLVTSEVYVQY